MADTISGIAFALLAFATIGGALGVIGSRNVVHAAFWLLEVSVAAAGIYYLLDASFVALVQLLVYAGAVVVLMIFTVMITLRRREDAIRPSDFSWPALLLAAAFAGLLFIAVAKIVPAGSAMPAMVPSLADFGKLMFAPRGYVLAFEIASVLLTAALVAAVWWSREVDE